MDPDLTRTCIAGKHQSKKPRLLLNYETSTVPNHHFLQMNAFSPYLQMLFRETKGQQLVKYRGSLHDELTIGAGDLYPVTQNAVGFPGFHRDAEKSNALHSPRAESSANKLDQNVNMSNCPTFFSSCWRLPKNMRTGRACFIFGQLRMHDFFCFSVRHPPYCCRNKKL